MIAAPHPLGWLQFNLTPTSGESLPTSLLLRERSAQGEIPPDTDGVRSEHMKELLRNDALVRSSHANGRGTVDIRGDVAPAPEPRISAA